MEFDRVKQVIVDQLGVDESAVTMDASFVEDLGADSLDIVELIMGLETEFDIEIPDEEAVSGSGHSHCATEQGDDARGGTRLYRRDRRLSRKQRGKRDLCGAYP